MFASNVRVLSIVERKYISTNDRQQQPTCFVTENRCNIFKACNMWCGATLNKHRWNKIRSEDSDSHQLNKHWCLSPEKVQRTHINTTYGHNKKGSIGNKWEQRHFFLLILFVAFVSFSFSAMVLSLSEICACCSIPNAAQFRC